MIVIAAIHAQVCMGKTSPRFFLDESYYQELPSTLELTIGLVNEAPLLVTNPAAATGIDVQFTQMTDIVDKTHRLYKPMGAKYVGPPSWTWTFPSRAKVRLAYISTDKDFNGFWSGSYWKGEYLRVDRQIEVHRFNHEA